MFLKYNGRYIIIILRACMVYINNSRLFVRGRICFKSEGRGKLWVIFVYVYEGKWRLFKFAKINYEINNEDGKLLNK